MGKFKRTTDNRMRPTGHIDFGKSHIRVNKKKSKSLEGKKAGGVIDTIVHEEMHGRHPKMHEKTIIKDTKKAVSRMGPKAKAKHYGKFR